jgi:Holliday junction DNA helicase RuvA
MIGRLRGTVADKQPPFFILDVNGVGYLVQSSVATFNRITEGQEITIYTKCVYKEDDAAIYGFLTHEELKTFSDLISVSGVGPKSGLSFLSTFTPEEIAHAIDNENLEVLSSVPRIGTKLASKIVLELKGKLKFDEKPKMLEQAVNALCSLGLTRSEAVQRLKGLPQDLPLEEIVKQALRK